jgi:rRNA maturation endonuclease Nob1
VTTTRLRVRRVHKSDPDQEIEVWFECQRCESRISGTGKFCEVCGHSIFGQREVERQA